MSAAAAKSCGVPTVYHGRQPERTLLHHVVQDHLATWLALHDDGCGGHAPALTEREFRRYLECGILAHGFARARCPDCGHDFLVAYSCPTRISFGHKGRGVCPSCTTPRSDQVFLDWCSAAGIGLPPSSSSTSKASGSSASASFSPSRVRCILVSSSCRYHLPTTTVATPVL